MEFFEALTRRRSVRRFSAQAVPEAVVDRALDAALLAPNSSNMQTWGFYWVRTPEKKAELVRFCLNQSAAKKAQELIVCTAEPHLWKQNQKDMLAHLKATEAHAYAFTYYRKLVPMMYGRPWLAPLKWILIQIAALKKPVPRHPWSYRDSQDISLKSSALACENFMLAISAQGYDTCPMEGFDEVRVKKLLGLRRSTRITMVIAVGHADANAHREPQLRFERSRFIHRV